MSPAPAAPPTRLRKAIYLGDLLAEPPSPDLMKVLDRHRSRRDAVVTVLQQIQGLYGYLPKRSVEEKMTRRGMTVLWSRMEGDTKGKLAAPAVLGYLYRLRNA